MSARLPVLPMMSARYDGRDDGHRLEPRYESLGDTSVPCRWWHPDIGGYCARCGSARIDLHAGEWVHLRGGINFGKRVAPEECEVVVTAPYGGDYGGLLWSDAQRVQLGLPVAEEWWHEAAGWPVNGGSTQNRTEATGSNAPSRNPACRFCNDEQDWARHPCICHQRPSQNAPSREASS